MRSPKTTAKLIQRIIVFKTPGGEVLDPWLAIGVPLRVSNPDPV